MFKLIRTRIPDSDGNLVLYYNNEVNYKCGINWVQATVSYAPRGSDRKLSIISTISVTRAAMYMKEVINATNIMIYRPTRDSRHPIQYSM
jgi:hypothetical protein